MPRPHRLGLHGRLRWAGGSSRAGAAVRQGQPFAGSVLVWVLGAADIRGSSNPVTPPHSDMQVQAGPWHGSWFCWKQGQSWRHPLQAYYSTAQHVLKTFAAGPRRLLRLVQALQ